METALIVSHMEKHTAFFEKMLSEAACDQIVTLQTCGEARRMLLERDFDLVLVSAPLPDESGESLARHVAAKGVSQVILIVKNEYFDAISALCEDDGVLVVARPMNKTVFWSALKLAKAANHRLRMMRTENSKLKQKIEDIRVVDRAKCVLISYLSMGEQEAHRYIEKQAMDMRVSRRAIAEEILKTYER